MLQSTQARRLATAPRVPAWTRVRRPRRRALPEAHRAEAEATDEALRAELFRRRQSYPPPPVCDLCPALAATLTPSGWRCLGHAPGLPPDAPPGRGAVR